jgi:hypothetical protein
MTPEEAQKELRERLPLGGKLHIREFARDTRTKWMQLRFFVIENDDLQDITELIGIALRNTPAGGYRVDKQHPDLFETMYDGHAMVLWIARVLHPDVRLPFKENFL